MTFDPHTIDHSRFHRSHSSASDSEPRTPDNEPLSHRSMANGFSPSYGSGHFSRDYDHATPKAKSRVAPQFNVEPPTPSANHSSGSKFAKLARNLAKDIEASQNWAGGTVKDNAVHSTTRQSKKSKGTPRKVFQNIANNLSVDEVEEIPPSYSKRSTQRSGMNYDADTKRQTSRRDDKSYSQTVQLPDVTGLTSAVGSPPRKDLDWRIYSGRSDSDAVEGTLPSFYLHIKID